MSHAQSGGRTHKTLRSEDFESSRPLNVHQHLAPVHSVEMSGDVGGCRPTSAPAATQTATRVPIRTAVAQLLANRPGLTAAEYATLLPGVAVNSVKLNLWLLVEQGAAHTTPHEARPRVWRYWVGPRPDGGPSYVNPIRVRALGLPVEADKQRAARRFAVGGVE